MELLLQSFVTAYFILFLLGVVRLSSDLSTVVRFGLIQVVPLGFGASLANELLQKSENQVNESGFPQNIGVFALGALFITFPLAPTAEMEWLATSVGWVRALGLIVVSVAVSYLILYELGFRGQSARTKRHSKRYHLGTAFVIYAVGLVISAALLVLFGHDIDTTVSALIQQTIVLSFPAAVGASAGEVVV